MDDFTNIYKNIEQFANSASHIDSFIKELLHDEYEKYMAFKNSEEQKSPEPERPIHQAEYEPHSFEQLINHITGIGRETTAATWSDPDIVWSVYIKPYIAQINEHVAAAQPNMDEHSRYLFIYWPYIKTILEGTISIYNEPCNAEIKTIATKYITWHDKGLIETKRHLTESYPGFQPPCFGTMTDWVEYVTGIITLLNTGDPSDFIAKRKVLLEQKARHISLFESRQDAPTKVMNRWYNDINRLVASGNLSYDERAFMETKQGLSVFTEFADDIMADNYPSLDTLAAAIKRHAAKYKEDNKT